jgi:hypothetical protein
MNTTNAIILVGVLGVGGVGAYMYMKNKQAQNALLIGSLPATNQGGGFVNTPTTSGTTTSSTTPIVKEVNLDTINFENALNALKNFTPEKAPHPMFKRKYEEITAKRYAILTKRFAELGYKYENGIVKKI